MDNEFLAPVWKIKAWFLLSFVKVIKSGVENCLLFCSQSGKALLKISEIPLPTFWGILLALSKLPLVI